MRQNRRNLGFVFWRDRQPGESSSKAPAILLNQKANQLTRGYHGRLESA